MQAFGSPVPGFFAWPTLLLEIKPYASEYPEVMYPFFVR